ncbi:uncharacterized protein LOC129797784 [Lutzomyia longipalpis]|uniref:uncharacterized protein LOC129797784 n=1 Tax=Lutzomyia longipalpis TaxID=7200 RepID=UPI00248370BE|nr:uncharacterized protein LOC129797784 [Lutzomyia longipalpis]
MKDNFWRTTGRSTFLQQVKTSWSSEASHGLGERTLYGFGCVQIDQETTTKDAPKEGNFEAGCHHVTALKDPAMFLPPSMSTNGILTRELVAETSKGKWTTDSDGMVRKLKKKCI